ncbi:MAG: universal stress protein [Flavobacteriales bacterium]|jgi:nucleotide-binding universal stress UspA family protein|nr:universal stress protein [Flavobacteriales bacterium]MCB0759541.1 universal stress protein [Flavobacteriales bacterium]
MTKNTANRILVPTDFTSVVDYAMDHAMKLANTMGAEVHLLHLVPDMDEQEVMQRRLATEQERGRAIKATVPLKTMLRKGKVYEGIGDAAKEIGAELIIMGTHGMRGMQFITGSRALRVIGNSDVPFIVVQERGLKADGYRDIVVPMDLQLETRQKLGLVAGMAAYFKGKAHVIVPKETDEFLHHQLQDNISFAEKFFGERGIAMEATVADTGSGGFVKAVLDHSKKVDADLIAVMNMTGANIFGTLGVPYEEEILTNEAMIPVMLLNPTNNTSGVSGWTFQ